MYKKYFYFKLLEKHFLNLIKLFNKILFCKGLTLYRYQEN